MIGPHRFERAGETDGLAEEGQNFLDGFGDGRVDGRQLVPLERREHVVGDITFLVGTSDAYLDALNLLRAERVLELIGRALPR